MQAQPPEPYPSLALVSTSPTKNPVSTTYAIPLYVPAVVTVVLVEQDVQPHVLAEHPEHVPAEQSPHVPAVHVE